MELELIKRHDLFQIAVWSCVFPLLVLWSPGFGSSNAISSGLLMPWEGSKGTDNSLNVILPGCHLTYSLWGPLGLVTSALCSLL